MYNSTSEVRQPQLQSSIVERRRVKLCFRLFESGMLIIRFAYRRTQVAYTR
jgi:hypothetical protein